MSNKFEEEVSYDELSELQDLEKEASKPKQAAAPAKDKKGFAAIRSAGFKDFLLKPELLRAIQDSGFEHPSEVQHECIPRAILGMDVLCQAKSGMGKTAVFVLSILQRLVDSTEANTVQAVILTHTRELAYQIGREFNRFSTHLPNIKCGVFIGGVNINTNIDALKNEIPNVVVGTPGKVLALVKGKYLSLDKAQYFVVDECDKVLESIEMRKDVQEIFKKTPINKQVMMFTATLNDEMRKLAKRFMHEPLEVTVDPEKLTLEGLIQHYVKLAENQKNKKLAELLDNLQFNQVVIFVSKVPRATTLTKLLNDQGFPAICIHSDLKQEDRISRYEDFKNFKKRILVTTDLFGRGIDIQKVNVVINYDMPDSADQYMHRIGRAGRFDTKGLAISFVSTDAPAPVKENSKYIRKPDNEILDEVQKRFAVQIPEMPDKIDASSYMPM